MGEQLVCQCGCTLFHLAPDLIMPDGSHWPLVTCAECGRVHLAKKEATRAP